MSDSDMPVLRYLEVVSTIDPRAGGVIAGINALARERTRFGSHTTVVSLDSPDAFPSLEAPYTWVGLGSRGGVYRYTPDLVPWLRDHARDFDRVIVNGLWQYHSFGAWRALHALGIPYLVFPHGMLDPWFKRTYPLKHVKKMLYWWWADYRVLRDAAAVCFTCDEERLLARRSFRRYRARECVVGYGVDDPPPASPAQTAAFAQAVPQAPPGSRILLFLSRIQEKKGCDLLLRAFASELASDPQWHLVMAGPDQEGWQATLAALARQLGIADRISWPGMLTGDAKWGAFRAAEVFCLPSHQENFGVVVAEALACGCPVLLSDQVNIWRETVDGGAGLVAPDTVAGTARLLKSWNASTARETMRSQSRPTFLRHFHIHAAARRIAQAGVGLGSVDLATTPS